ncbi:tyrosine-type recombinase/integrase [Paracoccus shanxieyensis]|uniref:Tyrosine-type recombinase/integrase n=1 Tax=Paracoccus shanxieyensis TaxID=2675752 RepID=A0A6L6IZM7_9RHOB|nr:site-specific integrase [Paracoccus shanxieyensis]MTH65985.1 tyrosine-type recombinase/integrase [Paracoccus shanxieyensis]MTH89023.1 tyrosine-type recombinase/integrase [Paracoccus shanxieyensis]
MPRVVEELKPAAVQALKHFGGAAHTFHAVGGAPGLMLQITATGGRSWVMRVRMNGTRKHFGLGTYDSRATNNNPGSRDYNPISLDRANLAEARRRADDIRSAIKAGADPAEAWRIGATVRRLMTVEQMNAADAWSAARDQRQAILDGATLADRMTFATAVDEYLKTKLSEFDNEKHRKQWRSTLDNYACPVIGKTSVDALTVHDIERVLNPIWLTKTETASRLRGRIENVLAWATVKKHRTGDNPARWKGNLDAIMPKPSKVADKDNQPALQLTDAVAWWKALRKREGMAARALEFLTLCASRSGEIRGATWDEFTDLGGDAPMWIIPASRMKAGKEHRVPLTPDAVALLDAMPRQADAKPGQDYVFWAARGGMLSDMSISAVMRRMQETAVAKGEAGWLDRVSKRPAVPHGLRSTFRDWVAERTDYPRDMAEMALAHTVGSEVERAYRRGDMLDKRRALMADWAAFLNG